MEQLEQTWVEIRTALANEGHSPATIGLISGPNSAVLGTNGGILRIAVGDFAHTYIRRSPEFLEALDNHAKRLGYAGLELTVECDLVKSQQLGELRAAETTPDQETPPPPSGPTVLGTKLDPQMTFANFVVTEGGNSDVFELATQFVQGRSPNRLYLHGLCGVGKTHLAQAICHALKGTVVAYISAPHYVQSYRRAISTNSWTAFNAFNSALCEADVAVVDDIHAILNGHKTLAKQFCDAYQGFYATGGGLIVISNYPPVELVCDDATSSRLFGHHCVEFAPPNGDLRLAIVQSYLAAEGLEVDPKLLGRITAELPPDVRILQNAFGAIRKVLLSGRCLDDTVVRAFAKRYPKSKQAGPITPEGVARAVLVADGVKEDEMSRERAALDGNIRTAQVSRRRFAIWYILCTLVPEPMNPRTASEAIGQKDRTSVIHGLGRAKADPNCRELINKAIEELGLPSPCPTGP